MSSNCTLCSSPSSLVMPRMRSTWLYSPRSISRVGMSGMKSPSTMPVGRRIFWMPSVSSVPQLMADSSTCIIITLYLAVNEPSQFHRHCAILLDIWY